MINRGGWSQSDFLIFDNYNIGRAVAKFLIPVITGIGHQKNVSITDLMAHTHTKTPTKAAEFIIAHNRSFEQKMLSLQQNIAIKSQQLFLRHYKELSQLRNAVSHNTRGLVQSYSEELAKTNQRIISSSRSVFVWVSKETHLNGTSGSSESQNAPSAEKKCVGTDQKCHKERSQ